MAQTKRGRAQQDHKRVAGGQDHEFRYRLLLEAGRRQPSRSARTALLIRRQKQRAQEPDATWATAVTPVGRGIDQNAGHALWP
jgi:hypothetical protein